MAMVALDGLQRSVSVEHPRAHAVRPYGFGGKWLLHWFVMISAIIRVRLFFLRCRTYSHAFRPRGGLESDPFLLRISLQLVSEA